MSLIQGAVGCQGNITLRRQHNFYLYTTLDGSCQGFRNRWYQCEVGIDDVYRVLGLVDGIDIKSTHNLGCHTWFAIDDAHHFITMCTGGVRLQSVEMGQRTTVIVFHASDVLTCCAVPYPEEDALQLVDSVTFYTAVHVAPFAHLFRTFYIIVGYVHASRIGNLTIDNNNLTMVATVDVVYPRETDRTIFYNLYARLTQGLQMALLQGLVVGVVAETIKHGAYFNTFLTFLAQQVE